MDQDEHVDKDQHHDQVQEESIDQGGDVDKDESNSRPTHHIQECATPPKEITP
jgi:hypothetical protein